MQKHYINQLNEKSNQLKDTAQKMLREQVYYVKTLPSIKQDMIRWTANVLYFGIGLMYNWAVYAVLQQMPHMQKFPSNVAGMIVLFFLLMCANTVSPRLTDRFVQFLDPYSSFALRSMNIMFVPAFVGIVSNPPVSGPELGRMICVFIVGYLVAFFLCTFLVRFFRLILFFPLQKTLLFASNEKTKIHHNQSLAEEEVAIETSMIHQQQSIIAIPSAARHSDDIDRASCSRTLTGEPLQGIVHNASNANSIFEDSGEQRYGPLHHFAIWCMEQSCFDDLTFFILFCICAFIFLPLPYDSPAMPFFRLFLYFFMTILLFSLSCRLPSKVRMVIHPIILTSACVMAGIAYFERTKGFDIRHGVYLYKAGITFVSLVEKTNVGWPGGGDILSTAMDVSIISLAFNVYKSRPSSLREWAVIFMSIAPIAFLVMFVTPLFAHAIGCSPDNSLVWSSRSVTTAIGIVIAKVLDANTSIVTCIIIFTGICGPLLGPFLFRLARVSDDDYMTIGITMGSSSHGVGTAYLISKNPRASGMASLAFAIFGTIGVIVASIPTLSDTLRHLAGF